MAKSDVLVRMKADTTGYDANIAKARRQLDQFKRDNLTAGGALKQLSGTLMSTAAKFASVTAAVGALGMAFKNNIETARNFEKSMSQLSSLTGMVGNDLGKLKEYAIELGSSTTLSASQVADAFKMIGSQQPQLLASGEALKAVTKNAITLSEAAGIELSEAAKTLSVSINQMGGDSANAERYINVLAAAAQKGAGDIVWLGEAITKSGTTAKAVGTDYEELVANLEQLAKAGYDASTAGTALRSIIMNLEKQSNQNFKPSVVGLTQAFKNLGQANLTLTQYQELTGKMFAAQAKALADAAGEAENMKEQITGTNIAEEQAKTNTDNLDGSIKALSSAWEGFNLHLNSSNGLLRDVVDFMKDVVTWADNAYQKLDKFYKDYGWMLTGSKSGMRDSFASLFGQDVDEEARKRNEAEQKRQEKAKQLRKIAYETGVMYNGRYITKAEYEAEFGSSATSNTTVKTTKSGGSKTVKAPTADDLTKLIAKSDLGADNLKGADDANFVSPYLLMLDEIKEKILDVKDADLGSALDIPDIYQQKIKEMERNLKAVVKSANITADVVGNIGQAFMSIEDPAAKVAGTVMQAIASVALGYAQATVSAASMGPWAWIAFAASGLATMLATISSIHNATGYASGGEVTGNSYSGDNLWIRANAGEVVLNASQQNMLAQNLKGSGGGGGYSPSYVSGEQIWIALNAYAKRTGKGEVVTWR